MNVFVPQDLDARAELLNLSTTKHNIMSSQSTKNIICITQDSLLGSYLLTKDDTDLGRDKFFDICMKGDNWSSEFILKRLQHVKRVMKTHNKDFPIYCGKSLFSLMLPATFNYTKKNDVRKDEPVVKIVKGVLLEGALAKSNLGQAHNSIVHVLFKEYGMDTSIDFINNCQFISNQFLIHRGFSIGLKDCITKIEQKTEDIAYRCFIEAKDTEATISHERIRELKICSILDNARDMSMKLAKNSLNQDNAFVATVTSGAKGEMFNISQITSMLGQQIHMGKRIQKTLNRGRRTLPHYPKENLTIEQEFESQGFIKHSFLHGLNPQEFIWHAISGREGCSNSSLQTANSGYIQRKMIKTLEDVQVKYDGTVRNSQNWVVQWAYGGDGFDRENCSVKDEQVFFADVQRIASRLNNEFELKEDEELLLE
jgi:DNA-directed RNA polymerase II subunit RPB1